jgi:hypothetical protein
MNDLKEDIKFCEEAGFTSNEDINRFLVYEHRKESLIKSGINNEIGLVIAIFLFLILELLLLFTA